jgi:hypothetical protein
MKTLLVGLWIAAVALGSTLATAYLKATPARAAKETAAVPQVQKARGISVPIIADGAVRGYVVAEFSFTVDPDVMRQMPLSPEVFLLDEAFRLIYSDPTLDFKHLEKYDLTKLTTELTKRTNARLGVKLLKQVLVQDFNFAPKDENDK